MTPAPRSLSASALLEKIKTSSAEPKQQRIKEVLQMAEELYEGHVHDTGVTLLEHVLGTADILLPISPDEESIIGCLLQHVLELKKMDLTELEARFGVRVRSIVSSIHLLAHVGKSTRRHSIDDLRLMLMSIAEDMRVLFVVLAERVFVMEHMDGLPPAEKRRACRGVLSLFAPVAGRLGMHLLKQRLEGLAFPIVYPSDAERITEQLQLVHKRYGNFLPLAARSLQANLRDEGMEVTVEGREKHPYSIFQKMRRKSLSHVSQLHDLFAFRVIVQTVPECYQVLGFLHRLGRPVANRFKDYIAIPKPNGYQSLHTTVARLPNTPEEIFVEVQVRTQMLHREAEYGIAAHWMYKEHGGTRRAMEQAHLQQLLTSQQGMEDEERPGTQETLADHIYVLTPKGDIVELPEGATPLDFAFQIHTNLGLSFRSARVNGRIVPVHEELEDGDIVEILTHRTPRPSPEWMQLLKMGSSRSRLKRYLYSLDRDHFVARGRDLLNEQLREHHVARLDADLSLLRTVNGQVLNKSEREDLLMKVGQGSERVSSVLLRLNNLRVPPPKPAKTIARTSPRRASGQLVEMEGNVRMPTRYAKCCKPLEEEVDPKHPRRSPIIGFITRTGEVSVHRQKCRMVKNANPERKISVWWVE